MVFTLFVFLFFILAIVGTVARPVSIDCSENSDRFCLAPTMIGPSLRQVIQNQNVYRAAAQAQLSDSHEFSANDSDENQSLHRHSRTRQYHQDGATFDQHCISKQSPDERKIRHLSDGTIEDVASNAIQVDCIDIETVPAELSSGTNVSLDEVHVVHAVPMPTSTPSRPTSTPVVSDSATPSESSSSTLNSADGYIETATSSFELFKALGIFSAIGHVFHGLHVGISRLRRRWASNSDDIATHHAASPQKEESAG